MKAILIIGFGPPGVALSVLGSVTPERICKQGSALADERKHAQNVLMAND